MIIRRHLLAGLALSLPAIRSAAAAWPADRPIEVIIPFPPGGGVDAVGRFATHHITARLPGVRFVVVNRAGASGQLGMEAIFNAAPDGYTIGAIGSLNVSTLPLERPVRWKAEEFTYFANIVDDACGPRCAGRPRNSPISPISWTMPAGCGCWRIRRCATSATWWRG